MEPELLDKYRQETVRDYVSQVDAVRKQGTENPLDWLADKDGKATPLADVHFALLDQGLINENGALTDKGQIYNSTYRDSVDGPFEIYKQREKLGLNSLDKDNQEDGGGMLAELGKSAIDLAKMGWSYNPTRILASEYYKAGSKAIDFIGNEVSSLFGAEQKEAKQPDVPAFLQSPMTKEQVINSGVSMVKGGANTLMSIGIAETYLPQRAIAAIQGNEDQQIALKQKQEQARFFSEEIEGAKLFDGILETDSLMKNREKVVSQIGEEATKSQEQSAQLSGGLILDPINIASAGVGIASNIGLKSALWAERTALVARGLSLRAGELAVTQAQIEGKLLKVNALKESALNRANSHFSVGNDAAGLRYQAAATRADELASRFTADLEDVATRQATVANDVANLGAKAEVAQKMVAATERLNAIKQFPFDASSKALGYVGEKLTKLDGFVDSTIESMGAKAIYDAVKSMPGKLTSIASTNILGPIAAAPAAIASVLGAGPMLEGLGNYSRILGEQLMKERAASSYWRRVANAGVSKPQRLFSKFMDEATLGGSLTNGARIIAKGTAHAYPIQLSFDVLQDPDLDLSKSMVRAVEPSLIFGGGFAGAGQIFKGSAGRLRDVQAADQINFIRAMPDSQKPLFSTMSKDGQKLVSSYSAAFPNLNWEFKSEGQSHYDRASNTASINVNTNNPIRALITHEVLHYTTIRNNLGPAVRQLMLGFDGEAGLIKKADGTLEPSFQKFHDEYNARIEAAGLPNESIGKIAEEYFNEATVDHVLDLIDRGKLSAYTGRTESNRIITNAVRTMIEKRPILRDFFFKTGGVMDANGRMVMGNGLLADGIMSHPEARKLAQQMIRESAGNTKLATGGIAEKFDKGKLTVDQNSPIVDSFHAILEFDDNGNPIKKDGVHQTISRELDEKRSMSGLILTEAQTRRVNRGYMPDEGELRKTNDGTWQGRYIHKALLDELAVKGALNSKQISILRNISSATKAGDGARFIMVNHPATIKGRGGKVRYASLEATLRDTVPVGFSVTKSGNILVHIMSVDQLHANIEKRAASKSGGKLYGSDTELIKQDVAAMMDIHALKADNLNPSTDSYYQQKYGASWKQHKDFINTVFGLMTAEQRSYNPMFQADKVGDSGVYRTYRADRISKAIKDHSAVNMPMSYDHIKVNMLPEGIPARIEAENTDRLKSEADLENGVAPKEEKITDLVNQGYDLMHARGDSDIKNSRDVIQFADWPKTHQKNEHYGKNHYVIKSSDLTPVPDWAIEWLSKRPEMIEYAKENGTNPLDEARKSMDPKDIVDSAGFWDDRQNVSDFYQDNEKIITNHGIVGFKTNDGGVIFDPYTASEKGIFKKTTDQINSPPASSKQYMPEIVDPEDKGIQAPIGSLGELRKNVDIRKSDLPADASSVPKFVARENKDGDWKVMEGPLRVARGNYLTPLPNIKIKKTAEFSIQNQNLVQNAFLAKSPVPTDLKGVIDPKGVREKQNAIRNTNDSLEKIGLAVKEIESDPQKFVDPKGYAETMKKAGVTGDVLIPPSSLKMMLEDPDAFTSLLSGGYHGDKTVAGIRESAMSGLDSVVEMRKLIGGRPPDLITAIHHLWGTLSKQLPPLQQEALWMRMITNKEVMQQIGESINGTFNQSPAQWKNTVKKARRSTVGTYGKLGNNATSNANSFYLMLSKHNGRWGEVSDVYKNNDAVQMRYDFNALGHGATGIKNKVQSFIGLTFGIKGNVLDRWRFIDMYLADAMKITGAKTARDYFKYEGKGKNVPVDKIGIYKNYGTIENKSPLFSLALYSAMDRVSQAAINASPSLQALLGNHADPGGLHWLSWNAIKNEAVGHSSLDITKNFIKDYAPEGNFDNLTVDNFLKFVNSTEAFVEGTSGGGEEITRLTLRNGVFSYTKK